MIPGLDDLLADLDGEAMRDFTVQANDRGIAVPELETPARLGELINRYDDLDRMTFSQLRAEYESRGFVTLDNFMSRTELLPLVREALIWSELNVAGLLRVCSEKKVHGAHAGLRREKLLQLLANPTWEVYGIPVSLFEDASTARDVLVAIRSLETCSRQEIVLRSREYGLPVANLSDLDLMKQLKKVIIWNHLPEQELFRQCNDLGLGIPGPNLTSGRTSRDAASQRLITSFWGAWGKQLEHMELSESFVRQFEALDGMSSAAVQLAFERLGLHVHPEVKDSDHVQILKQSLIWQYSPMEILKAACNARDLPLEPDEASDSLETRLLRHDTVALWQKRDLVPHTTFDHDTAVRIMQVWKDVDKMSMTDLKDWYKSLELPEEEGIDREHLQSFARKISSWQELSPFELERERQRLGLELVGDEAGSRQSIIDALTCRDRMDMWDAKGFQAHRIKDYQTVMGLAELHNKYSTQPTEELRKLCADAGLPHDFMDRGMILETLKTLLVWELLPLDELHVDCRARGIKTDVSGDDPRNELYQRLRVDLSVQLSKTTYVQKGIPVERLNSLAAANVLSQYENIETKSDEELREWYSGQLGFPAEAGLHRAELTQLAKQVSLWMGMDAEELERESQKKGVKPKEPGENQTRKEVLVDALLLQERMDAWEARGYRAQAVGDVEKVMQIVNQCEAWQKLGLTALRKALQGAGYMAEQGAGHELFSFMERPVMLEVLKSALIWELMPASTLSREFKQRLPHAQDGLGRDEQIRWLIRSTFANTWTARGIPAERLGSFQVTDEIINELDGLQAAILYHEMVGVGQKPLEDVFKKSKLPFDAKLDSQTLLDRWRDFLVWNRLSIPELQRDCRASGVSPDAPGLQPKVPSSLAAPSSFHNLNGAQQPWRNSAVPKLSPKGLGKGSMNWGPLNSLKKLDKSVKASDTLERLAKTKDDKELEEKGRRTLIERLVLATWTCSWKPRGIPAQRLDSIEKAEVLMQEIDHVAGLSEQELEEECGKYGAVFNKMCGREMALKRLQRIIVWREMPEEELKSEHRRAVQRGSSQDLDRGELMAQLFEHSILLESEAQGIPVLKTEDLSSAFIAMEGIDQGEDSKLKEWYEGELNMPSESCVGRAELVRIAKLLFCWENLPMAELKADCMKYGVECEADPDPGVRQSLINQLMVAERMKTWDSRGYQATRINDFDSIIAVVTSYEDYKHQGDIELDEIFKKMGIDSGSLEREEKLKMMKSMLVWEYLPLPEVKRECEDRGVEIAQTVARCTGGQQELQNELVHLLKIDLRVRVNKDKFEQRGIPVKRLGSLGAASVADHLKALDSRSMEDIRREYSSFGFSSDEQGLDRQHMLDILKTILIWQWLPLSELQRDCLDRDVPLHVDLEGTAEEDPEDLARTSPKRTELIQRLTIDLHVSENRSAYVQRGVPLSRLGTQKAYEVLMRFEEIDGYDIDTLRNKQKDVGLPPAPSLSKEDLLSRLKDQAIWSSFTIEELEKECRLRQLPSPKSVSSMRALRRELLLDTLVLHRCAKTYDEAGVPYKQLKSAKAANNVLQAWDDLHEIQHGEMWTRYTSLGLSTTLLDSKDIRERLKSVAVYNEVPFEDLQALCAARQISPGGDNRRELVRRLAQVLWPPREPPKPKPRPQPPPRFPPPPPRQPTAATSRMRLANYFQVLQLPTTAGLDEVKKAYKKLALKHHPDKNIGARDEKIANENFRKIAEAYEKLMEFFEKGK